MTPAPIIIVEDDKDDILIFQDVLNDLQIPNKIIWFTNGLEALKFLEDFTGQPFLIISDINLPGLNGMELKRNIDLNPMLRRKSIPFVFFTTSANKKYVDEAYLEMTTQGYFQKPNEYDAVRNSIRLMMEYWKVCLHPNSP